jgi:imidazolonepropionase-like amidohydrolase
MRIAGCLVILILAVACTRAAAPAPAPPPATTTPVPTTASQAYAIVDVTLIDVERGAAVPGQTVLVAGDRIDRIGPTGQVAVPPGVPVIAGHGLYLMPGLVDAHVHYLDAEVFGRAMLANGVLLVRDMGMPNEYILKLRDQLNQGKLLGPEMVAAGRMLDGDPPMIPSIALGIKTPEEGRAAVRQQAAAGVDAIKVYSKLDRASFLAIVDEAQRLDLGVVGHVPDSIYIEDAVAAGMLESEHFFGFEKVIAKLLGQPVDLSFKGRGADTSYLQRPSEVKPGELQAAYRRLRDGGLAVCPTIVTFKVMTNVSTFRGESFPHSEMVSQKVRDTWTSQWAQQEDLPDTIWKSWGQMVAGLHQAGVPLLVGTDLLAPGVIPGYAVHDEMAIWQQVGIPPADVLAAATIVPTQRMGLGARLGSLAEGKQASMVLVRANPLADIRNAQQIESIFLRGQYFSRTDLDRMLDEAKALAQGSGS